MNHGIPTLNQSHDAYLHWQELGQPRDHPGRVLPLDGFDDPAPRGPEHVPDQKQVIDRLRRRMRDVVTSTSSGERGVFQVSLRIFNPDPQTYRRCEPVGAFMPETLPDPPHRDDVPTIQLDHAPTGTPEQETEPMTAAPAMNGNARLETDPTPRTTHHVQVAGFAADELSVEQVKRRVDLIRELMESVMKEGEHYGKVPGCGDKMVLLKPGAEKLRVVFGLGAAFKVRRTDLPDNHREYEVRCILRHLSTGRVVGEGMGCCSTMESKYRWRKGERVCPKCDGATIMRSKFDDCGWYCNTKRGGCGAKFALSDPAIEGQQIGRVPNPDLADTYNTVLKIAEKRAAVDATLNATGASDLFTQDLDDRQPVADNTREPFNPEATKAAQQPTGPEAARQPGPSDTPPPAGCPLTRDDLLDALKRRGLDGGQARTIYGWFGKQVSWRPTAAQNRQFVADIEAGRFDGGIIRPKDRSRRNVA